MVLLDVRCSFEPFGVLDHSDLRHSNLPIGALVFILVVLGLNPKVKREPIRDLWLRKKVQQLDPFGVILLLGAVCCLFLALQWGGNNYSWCSSKVIGLLVGFCLLLVPFFVLQWWLAEKATIPARILRHRTLSYGALALFFISMSSNIVRLQLLSPWYCMQLMWF